jgi:RNA polymerase sigma-70 factor (ECF subfamily)
MPWIFSIAHFRVTDYLRKIYANRRSNNQIEKLAYEALNVTLQHSGSESIDEYLDELPMAQKTMLRSLYFEGLSARETANKMGMGESAVKTAVHRVLKKLRLSLNGRI